MAVKSGLVKRVSAPSRDVQDIINLIQELSVLLDYFNVSDNHIYNRSALKSPL